MSLKLYYKDCTEPIVVGLIDKLDTILVTDNSYAKFRLFENSWNGRYYSSTGTVENFGSTFVDDNAGSGFDVFIQNATKNTDYELFLDNELTESTGLACNFSGYTIRFKAVNKGVVLWTVKNYNGKAQLVTLHKGDKYIDFLKSIAKFERSTIDPVGVEVGEELLPMNMSPITAPFITCSRIENAVHIITNYYSWDYLGCNACLSFATLYEAYTGHQVVKTDSLKGTILGNQVNNAAPCVRYDPRCVDIKSITKDGCYYGYDSSELFFTVSKFSDSPSNLFATEEYTRQIEGMSVGNVGMFCSPFIQLGDAIGTSPTNYDFTNISVFKSNVVKAIHAATSPKESWRVINDWVYANAAPMYVIQNISKWNVSKYLHENPDVNMGEFETDKGNKKYPLFNLLWSYNPIFFNSDNKFTQYRTLGWQCFTFGGDYSKITGAQYLQWLFNGEWTDGGNVPDVPSDIPEDNGNGGFNNSDYLGGNGSWQDTTTDMSYNKNNPLWHTPDNLGLDGNYDIVKLNRASVEMLAKQTWTQDGWLAYLAKMSNISRAGDGIADIKTCFAEIPTTGAAQIAAIAGYGLKSPIPCRRVNQYNQFDMGTVNVPVYFGSFLDYAPYTEIVLELPFAQPVKIPPEVVVGQNINLTLSVDLMSSSAMYIITCGGRLLAQVPANIFINLPFAASEYTEGAISALAGYIANAGNIGSNIAQGARDVSEKMSKAKSMAYLPEQAGSEVANTLASGIHEVASRGESRNITQISQGGGGGAIGAMGLKYATLKITRPYVTIPPRYYELNGCPSGFVKRVGDCTGYLEVDQIYGAIPCNTDEFNAIVSQLKGGIFP